MLQEDSTRRALYLLVLLLTVALMVATFSGGATARSLAAPGNCTTGSLFHEMCSQDGDGLTSAATTSEQSQEYGVCMIGVSSPCNSNEWEDSSLAPGNAAHQNPSALDNSSENNDGDTSVQFSSPDFDTEFSALPDDNANSTATKE